MENPIIENLLKEAEKLRSEGNLISQEIKKLEMKSSNLFNQASDIEEAVQLLKKHLKKPVVKKPSIKRVKKDPNSFTPLEQELYDKIFKLFKKSPSPIILRKDICLEVWGFGKPMDVTTSKRLISVLEKSVKRGLIIENREQRAFTYSLTPLAFK